MPAITNAVERFFFNDLSRTGLDKVSRAGVDKLLDLCRNNQVADTVVPSTDQTIDDSEKAALNGLLDKDDFRALLDQPGRAALEVFLGRATAGGGGQVGQTVTLPKGSKTRYNLSGVGSAQLVAFFAQEIERRRSELFAPSIPKATRGESLYLLFADYAQALNATPNTPARDKARTDMLQALLAQPDAATLLFVDSDGDYFGNAWELLFGTNPEDPQNSFADREQGWATYQSMNGTFYEVAEKLDAYLAAAGRPAKIGEYEKRSAVAWLMGEDKGNTIGDSLDEDNAITSTQGVDFCRGLFPANSPVWGLKLAKDFDIAVDFLDGFERFVTYDRTNGDRMVAKDQQGNTLTASYVTLQEDGQQRYKPVFTNGAGKEIAADAVLLVIEDSQGRVKGNAAAGGSVDTGWWGFCDRNTLNEVITTRFAFAEPKKPVTLTVGGTTHTFSADEIRDTVGRRLTEIFPATSFAGYRYDGAVDTVRLRDGTILTGRLEGNIDLHRIDHRREGDNLVAMAPRNSDGFALFTNRIIKDGERIYVEREDGSMQSLPATFLGESLPLAESIAVAWGSTPELMAELAAITNDYVARYSVAAQTERANAAIDKSLALIAADPDADVYQYMDTVDGLLGSTTLPGLEADAEAIRALGATLVAGKTREEARKAINELPPDAPERALLERYFGSGDEFNFYVAFQALKATDVAAASALLSRALLGQPIDKVVARVGKDALLAAMQPAMEEHRLGVMESVKALAASSRLEVKAARRGAANLALPTEADYVVTGFSGDEANTSLRMSRGKLRFFRDMLEASDPLAQRVTALAMKMKQVGPATQSMESYQLPVGRGVTQNMTITLGDGSQRTLKSSDISILQREDMNELLASTAIAYVLQHNGVIAADSATSPAVSNGMHRFTAKRTYRADDANAPEWVKEAVAKKLIGYRGPVADNSKLVFVELGLAHDNGFSSELQAFIEFDKRGVPVNEGTLEGSFDFLWSPIGTPDWDATPTFNPHVPNDLVLQLYVRSLEDPKALADAGLLPSNWQTYLA